MKLEVSKRSTVNWLTGRLKKDAAKLRAELYKHGPTYDDVFRDIDRDFTGLLRDSDLPWNMDEISVNIEFGERSKSCTSSSTHYGGFNAVTTGGNGKHVTTVVAVSASGLMAPPFLIVPGKHDEGIVLAPRQEQRRPFGYRALQIWWERVSWWRFCCWYRK